MELGDNVKRRRRVNMEMSKRIVEILEALNMTQKELAKLSGITESAISHYVKGDRVPRGVNLKKIALALGTTSDYLLGKNEDNSCQDDIKVVKTLIARNAAQMSVEDKMELVKMLID